MIRGGRFFSSGNGLCDSLRFHISCGVVLCWIVSAASEARAGTEDMAIFQTPPWDQISYSPEDIIKSCTQSLESTDNLPGAIIAMLYQSRGEAYARVRQFKLARDDMSRALKIRKEDVVLQAWIAFLSARLGECLGHSELEAIVKKKPTGYLPYQLLAELQFKSGQNRICIDSASLALAQYDQPKSYHIRAQAYLKLGEDRKMLADLDLCILNWPSFDIGSVQYLRGSRIVATCMP